MHNQTFEKIHVTFSNNVSHKTYRYILRICMNNYSCNFLQQCVTQNLPLYTKNMYEQLLDVSISQATVFPPDTSLSRSA